MMDIDRSTATRLRHDTSYRIPCVHLSPLRLVQCPLLPVKVHKTEILPSHLSGIYGRGKASTGKHFIINQTELETLLKFG